MITPPFLLSDVQVKTVTETVTSTHTQVVTETVKVTVTPEPGGMILKTLFIACVSFESS